jgi:uncharacterized protein (TIGR02145 family)
MKSKILFFLLFLLLGISAFSQGITISNKNFLIDDYIDRSFTKPKFVENVQKNSCTQKKYKVELTLKNMSDKPITITKSMLQFWFEDSCLYDPVMHKAQSTFQWIHLSYSPFEIASGGSKTGTNYVVFPPNVNPENVKYTWLISGYADGELASMPDTAKIVTKEEIKIEEEPDFFIDQRDGKKYKTVKIGTQVWMAENLNYYTADSYCMKSNPSVRFYECKIAMNVCPSGWHLPSKEEWMTLINFAGGQENGAPHLKSIFGWNKDSEVEVYSDNNTGFNAIPYGYYLCNNIWKMTVEDCWECGNRYENWKDDKNHWDESNNSFEAYFWSSTSYYSNCYTYILINLSYYDNKIRFYEDDEFKYYNVRCVKN